MVTRKQTHQHKDTWIGTNMQGHKHAGIGTHTHTHTQKHRQTHIDMDGHTHRHRHTGTNPDTRTHTHGHRHKHPDIQTRIQIRTHSTDTQKWIYKNYWYQGSVLACWYATADHSQCFNNIKILTNGANTWFV